MNPEEEHEIDHPEPAEQTEPSETEAPAPERRPRRIGTWILILILVLVIGAGAAWLELRLRLAPVSAEEKKVLVSIPKGATVEDIGRLLEQKGVIRSAKLFRYYIAYKELGPKLKYGEHIIDAGLSTPQIIDSLIKGRFKLHRLTIPEGLTLVQIAELADKAGLADRKEFLKLAGDKKFIKSLGLEAENLEGYLFPETYHFTMGTPVKDLVKAMTDRFFEVWNRCEPLAKDHTLSRHQIVTLASIVEKETGLAAERPLIAAVFLNRLKKGMRLETDPTVIYGLKDFDGNLTKKHLQTPTPFNTYLIEGLPPGPIANPGEASLKAVLEPAQVDFLFFVSKNDGSHYFSKTVAEHERAVTLYQRSQRQ
ncbi:MAG: endolytic transglycosylase MltG [Pseudomonadota bacterium]